MSRQDLKDEVYLNMAKEVSRLGTCLRLKVGCVLLSEEGKVVGTWYNGAGPGMPHCECDHCNSSCRCVRTLHAEKNSLSNKSGKPYTAYVTAEPCLDCLKSLASEGVRRVVFLNPYTSIAENERIARQEWIDFYNISWVHWNA